MPRQSISVATRDRIHALRRPGESLRAFRKRLAAEGVSVSIGSLHAIVNATAPAELGEHAAKLLGSIGAMPSPRAIDDAIESGNVPVLQRAAAHTALAIDTYGRAMTSGDHASARSFARMVEIAARVERAIYECTPRAEVDRYAPLEAEALAAIVARTRAAITADEAGELREENRRLANMNRALLGIAS